MDYQPVSMDTVENLSSTEFEQLMRETPDGRLVDVRTELEYAMGHIPGSELFDLTNPDWPDRIDALDRDAPVFLYCRSGNRSYQAAMYMQQIGFTRVYNLADGIIAWTGEITRD